MDNNQLNNEMVKIINNENEENKNTITNNENNNEDININKENEEEDNMATITVEEIKNEKIENKEEEIKEEEKMEEVEEVKNVQTVSPMGTPINQIPIQNIPKITTTEVINTQVKVPVTGPNIPIVNTPTIENKIEDKVENKVEDKNENNNVKEENKEKPKRNSTKKKLVNLQEIENDIVNNGSKMLPEERFYKILELIGLTPAGLGKIFGYKPGNRILQSVRAERPLKDAQLNEVYEYMINHENVKNHPGVIPFITKEFLAPPRIKK